jgi:sarcosine oxidase subunit gamma
MPEVAVRPTSGGAATSGPLQAGQRDGLAIVNLRLDPGDPTAVAAVRHALGLGLPLAACATDANGQVRIVWAGPDDWFVIGAPGAQAQIVDDLRLTLAGTHHAVTDVSSGYLVVRLAGPSVRDVLAQGCPLDLHPHAFVQGQAAGSHFFKASIYLWQVDPSPTFEMLVRRSFMAYFWQMLRACTIECGLTETYD